MSSLLAVCSGLIVGRLIFCLVKQEHYGPRSLFFTGFQINDCFYLIEFNGCSALIGSVLIVELIFLGMQSEPVPQQM